MYKLSQDSRNKLATCDEILQMIVNEAIKDSPIDFSITCGFRGEKEQNEAFSKGNSKLKYPNSNHNKKPSKAVDIVPFPRMWDATDKEFKILRKKIKKIASKHGIKIKWGGDWKFIDKPHYEL